MLDPLMLPPECPTCGRSFVSWPSVNRHLRLDHPAADDDPLTVDDVLAARPLDAPVVKGAPPASAQQRALASLTQPPVLAVLVWVGVLYGLAQLRFDVGLLVAWSFVGVTLAGVLVARAWARSELNLQEEIRRRRGRP